MHDHGPGFGRILHLNEKIALYEKRDDEARWLIGSLKKYLKKFGCFADVPHRLLENIDNWLACSIPKEKDRN